MASLSRIRLDRVGPAAVVAAALLATVMLVSCGSSTGSDAASNDAASGGDKPLVVVTTTQLADFARAVGGDDVEVYGMLRPNLDAHDFEPSPADIDALARADVIVENGLGLEPWLDDAVAASGTSVEVIDASDGASLLSGGSAEDNEGDGEPNPHIWFDPTNAQVMVDHVADAIAAAVPSAATAVEERAQAYDDELTELDNWIFDEMAPLDGAYLVTDHDAFPYFIDRYGLVFVGSVIPSFDSAAEVSPADLNDLAAKIDDLGVTAIFSEQSLPPDSAEALARKTDAVVVSGDDGLYGDSLGPEGSDGGTYLGMMRHNTSTIVENLQ